MPIADCIRSASRSISPESKGGQSAASFSFKPSSKTKFASSHLRFVSYCQRRIVSVIVNSESGSTMPIATCSHVEVWKISARGTIQVTASIRCASPKQQLSFKASSCVSTALPSPHVLNIPDRVQVVRRRAHDTNALHFNNKFHHFGFSKTQQLQLVLI